MSTRYKFEFTDVLDHKIKTRVDDYIIENRLYSVERNGHENDFYLYLKFVRIIVENTHVFLGEPIYRIDLQEFMKEYYDHPNVYEEERGEIAGDNKLILKFIFFVYLQYPYSSDFKNKIWFASTDQLCFYGLFSDAIDANNDLIHITLMRYRAYSYIAEFQMQSIVLDPDNPNETERYRHIVDIVRNCVNYAYDLSDLIRDEYKTHSFGHEDEEDEYYKLHCPIGYNPNNKCNFKLRRMDINTNRSKKILVNTVLIKLSALIDLHIDIEHENEIHDAIRAICEDYTLSIYILPYTWELLNDSCKFFNKYFSLMHIDKETSEKNQITVNDMEFIYNNFRERYWRQ